MFSGFGPELLQLNGVNFASYGTIILPSKVKCRMAKRQRKVCNGMRRDYESFQPPLGE